MSIKLVIDASEEIQKYYESIGFEVDRQLEVAGKAKAMGLDASTKIETTPAADLADRTETIIGPPGIAKRYREVIEEKNGDRMQAVFQLFKEIIDQKWCRIEDDSKRVEQAIKTCLVLNTDGVVVAPLDGVPEIKISKNPDGSKYIDIYYAGPIRAAGGTATVLPLILGDYARILLGLDRFKPTEDEIGRYIEECQIYEETVSRQYKLSEEEIKKIIRGCTVCINGEPTEDKEVSVHRNLARIPSNRVRGGMCLVISEGIALKAAKILGFAKQLNLEWSWLEGIIKIGKSESGEKKLTPIEKFLEGAAAGRPIFSYPSTYGGFRLRYGRGRNTGIMGKGMHPATMHMLDEFVAVSTQLKVERPGKAAGIAPVDSIEGPIIRLYGGDVVKVNTLEEAIRLRPKMERILFLGDLLVSVGDFRYSAHPLVPAGYCPEWWAKELARQFRRIPAEEGQFAGVMRNPEKVSVAQAIELSQKYNVPLHPNALHYYGALDKKELLQLIGFLQGGKIEEEGGKAKGIAAGNSEEGKALLERIGLPHRIEQGNILIAADDAAALEAVLCLRKKIGEISATVQEADDTIDALNRLSGLTIRDKAGTFIGSRMGRPEASRPRKMVGNPNVLFPIGLAGGNTRSINRAMQAGAEEKKGIVTVEIALFVCPKCRQTKEGTFCRQCGTATQKITQCPTCGKQNTGKKCEKCNSVTVPFTKREIDLQLLVQQAASTLGIKAPDLIKGVKGMINEGKIAEPIEKGLLRAKHDMHIFRDATIRYEIINAPLTHFTPKEIATPVETLLLLGYSSDIEGKPLESETQVVELFPQDIVIHEKAGDFFVKVTQFIDEMLERFYKAKPYFNSKTRNDLIGQLLLGLAPHTSAAIVGRIVGYTKARTCFAHPYFHQTKRRNIDGDQDSLMLLMDGLINFSHAYLPGSRGGRMDAPLVFTIALKPTEIDNECYEMERGWNYPVELYEKAQKMMPAKIDGIETVGDMLNKKKQYSGFGYTHATTVFDAGPTTSRYVSLATMEEKIRAQAELQNRIAAVDGKDALERVMVSHLLPDIIGNTRAFSRQTFRCTNCNAKIRRIPLDGKCPDCSMEKIILTVNEGGIRKYLVIAKTIAAEYGLSDYLRQRLDLITSEIDSLFLAQPQNQKKLAEFV